MDVDARIARIGALKANLGRYSRLLTTELTEAERVFIQNRIAEDSLALEALYASPSDQMRPPPTGAVIFQDAGA